MHILGPPLALWVSRVIILGICSLAKEWIDGIHNQFHIVINRTVHVKTFALTVLWSSLWMWSVQMKLLGLLLLEILFLPMQNVSQLVNLSTLQKQFYYCVTCLACIAPLPVLLGRRMLGSNTTIQQSWVVEMHQTVSEGIMCVTHKYIIIMFSVLSVASYVKEISAFYYKVYYYQLEISNALVPCSPSAMCNHYMHDLSPHRKAEGEPGSFGTWLTSHYFRVDTIFRSSGIEARVWNEMCTKLVLGAISRRLSYIHRPNTKLCHGRSGNQS